MLCLYIIKFAYTSKDKLEEFFDDLFYWDFYF